MTFHSQNFFRRISYFCGKTYCRLHCCRWTCWRRTFYCKAICSWAFGNHIAFDQFLAIRLLVVRILSNIFFVPIFNDRLTASEFLPFFNLRISSSQHLSRDFFRPLTFWIDFFVTYLPSYLLPTDFSCKISSLGFKFPTSYFLPSIFGQFNL